ncbi:MAG: ribonuclease PH [Chloroflexota bacterium]|nr:ribonuclease PH [Chloroflexia bacterium]MDQ3226503.1 ribonuclease PH [Chloroflexota bacterium]
MNRVDGRAPDEMRPLQIIPSTMPYAEGSASIRLGDTHVLCTATVDERVPAWMRGQGRGWVTAEYGMLPRATKERTAREAVGGRQGGRTVEIQRLIGRSLRAAVDLKALGERQVIIDCDVVRADGGTRCAAITGGYVALAIALQTLRDKGRLNRDPLAAPVAAVSVGIVRGASMLDLNYAEDSGAAVDCNIIGNAEGDFIEIQATAEGKPFGRSDFGELLDLANLGLDALFAAQREAIRASQAAG